MGKRIKKLRKALGLTQKEFGERIGVKPNTIGTYEIGRNEPIDAVISLICREFNVNEEWLKHGMGPMLSETNDFDLGAFVRAHNGSELELAILKAYFELDAGIRKTLLDHFKTRLGSLPAAGGVDVMEAAEEITPVVTLIQPYSQVAAAEGSGAFLLESGHDEVTVEMNEYTKRASAILKVIGRSMEPVISDGDRILVRIQPSVAIGEIGVFIIDGQGYLKEYAEDRLVSLNPDIDDVFIGDFQQVECYGKFIAVLNPDWVK